MEKIDREKVAIITLGCDKNRVDSEVMAGILQDRGYSITTEEDKADFIIINTCTFIKDAQAETEDVIDKALSYHDKRVIITGCHVQRLKDKIIERFPEASGYLGINSVENIDTILDKVKKGEKVSSFNSPTFLYERYDKRLISTLPGTAYIKIGEGCNHGCTFCIIPRVKGRSRSRTIEEIVSEGRYLGRKGVKEVVLVAQDLNSYGIDIYGRPMLGDLVRHLSEVEEIKWIRLLYMYPFNFPQEILKLMKEDEKLCKYIDLPLQHISNNILKAMGRNGSKEDIIRLINKIREEIPDVVLRSSFIVGFPGETEEDFEELYTFLEDMKFHWVGAFLYSKEEGTYAYNLKNHVPERIKKQRWIYLMGKQRIITSLLNKKRVGNEEDVLIEGRDKKGFYGRTKKEAPEVDGKVYIYNASEQDLGKIRRLRIISSREYDLAGALI